MRRPVTRQAVTESVHSVQLGQSDTALAANVVLTPLLLLSLVCIATRGC